MVKGLGWVRKFGGWRLAEGAALFVRQLAGQLEFRGEPILLCGLLLLHCFGSLSELTRSRIISANSAQSSGPRSQFLSSTLPPAVTK